MFAEVDQSQPLFAGDAVWLLCLAHQHPLVSVKVSKNMALLPMSEASMSRMKGLIGVEVGQAGGCDQSLLEGRECLLIFLCASEGVILLGEPDKGLGQGCKIPGMNLL